MATEEEEVAVAATTIVQETVGVDSDQEGDIPITEAAVVATAEEQEDIVGMMIADKIVGEVVAVAPEAVLEAAVIG